MQNEAIVRAFEQYEADGLDPLPIPPKDGHPTKGPITKGWPENAIKGHAKEDFEQPCNIGVLLGGGARNPTDIDCDNQWAIKAAGYFFIDADPYMVFGRKSKPDSHYVFFCDESLPTVQFKHPTRKDEMIVEFRCLKKKDRSRGLQTVFPPSLRWGEGKGPDEQIAETLRNPNATNTNANNLLKTTKAIAVVALLGEYFPTEGQRHETILALAGWFARSGMDIETAKLLIGGAYGISDGFNNDLDKAEADVQDVYKAHESGGAHLYGYTHLQGIMPKEVLQEVAEWLALPRHAQTTSTPIQTNEGTHYALTDTGLGLRFVDLFGADFRYVAGDGTWMFWDGSVWVSDDKQQRRERAKQIGKLIRVEADQQTVEEIEKAYNQHAKYAESMRGVDAMLKAASSDQRIVVLASDFDKHPELLNCKNGVVDLRTGQLRAHDRGLLMRQLVPTDYKSGASSNEFNTALDTWTVKHPDLKPYMRRLFGYSVTGTKHEEKIVIIHGPGGTGKGTWFSLLGSTLGGAFVKTAAANTFVDRKRTAGSASPDIERLEGARLIVCSEIERGTKLAEGFTKLLSGNDVITTRALFRGEKEFQSQGQLFFQTNYRPEIDSTDTGNRRRYIEIPFDNPMVQDKRLKDRLVRSTDVHEACLAWLVAGAVEYYRDGLGTCDSVEAATQDFFDANDELGGFLKDQLVREGRISRAELTAVYISWCSSEGTRPMAPAKLYAAIRERGFEEKQWKGDEGKTIRGFVGIRERTDYDLFRQAKSTAITAPRIVPEPSGDTLIPPVAKKPKFDAHEAYGHLKPDCPTQEALDAEFGADSGKQAWNPEEADGSYSTVDRSKFPSVFNAMVPNYCTS